MYGFAFVHCRTTIAIGANLPVKSSTTSAPLRVLMCFAYDMLQRIVLTIEFGLGKLIHAGAPRAESHCQEMCVKTNNLRTPPHRHFARERRLRSTCTHVHKRAREGCSLEVLKNNGGCLRNQVWLPVCYMLTLAKVNPASTYFFNDHKYRNPQICCWIMKRPHLWYRWGRQQPWKCAESCYLGWSETEQMPIACKKPKLLPNDS